MLAVCAVQGVCHRDLKLENTLLDGRPAPRLKICDFGYSKVTLLQMHCTKAAELGYLTLQSCSLSRHSCVWAWFLAWYLSLWQVVT